MKNSHNKNKAVSIMDKYNIFLCYRGEQAGLLARSIYAEIKAYKNKKLKVFYAPECIAPGEDFVKKCEEIASTVSLMITFVTKDFFEHIEHPEDVVALELRSALNNPNCTFLPIIFKDFDFKANAQKLKQIYTQDEISRITHINAINYTDVYTFDSFTLLGAILEHFSLKSIEEDEKAKMKKRLDDEEKNNMNAWLSDQNKAEKRRLDIQQKLLLKYDLPVYDKLLKGKSNLNVLDLGSGNGAATMARLGNRPEVGKIIGFDIVEDVVQHANEKYGNQNIKFYHQDVEAEDFEANLEEIMEENDIDGFDFVNVLAILSFLKKPSHLFKIIKRYCHKGAVIFVRNIDDGFNVAYPDEDEKFAKAMSLLQLCTSNGFRFDGRTIYTILQNRGYKNITLENLAINTVGMTVEEKEAFFVTVFGFVKKGIKEELALHPDSADLQEQYDWLMDIYDKLEEDFMNPAFFMAFGFLIYTAEV